MFWACPLCSLDFSPVNGGNPESPVTLTLEPPLNLSLWEGEGRLSGAARALWIPAPVSWYGAGRAGKTVEMWE